MSKVAAGCGGVVEPPKGARSEEEGGGFRNHLSPLGEGLVVVGILLKRVSCLG